MILNSVSLKEYIFNDRTICKENVIFLLYFPGFSGQTSGTREQRSSKKPYYFSKAQDDKKKVAFQKVDKKEDYPHFYQVFPYFLGLSPYLISHIDGFS